MKKELDALLKNEIWKVTELAKGAKHISCK